MSAHLLDINVLVALFWTNHEQHDAARRWFHAHQSEGWATCPMTQAGFVRVSSNPRVFPDAPSPGRAVELLGANVKHRSHRFWKDEVTLPDAVRPFAGRFTGHQQTTDAYLFGLALRKRGRLVTFDAGVSALADTQQAKSLVIIAT